MNDRALAHVAEMAEVRAWSDAVRAATPRVTQALGLRAIPIGSGIALVASEIRSLLYNRAFGIGLDAPLDEAALDRLIATYRPDSPFTIQPSPAARPAQVRAWLEARHLYSHFNWVRWVRDASPVREVPSPFRIEVVGRSWATRFVDLMFRIFDEPAALAPWIALTVGRRGWMHYVGFDGRRSVSVGALYRAGGAAWLGWGGTLASHRGRGGQTAMLARRIRDAAALGCRWVTLETAEETRERPNPSFRNARRAGFRLLYLRPSHAHRPPEEARRDS
jgi:hypothetical protein